MSHPRRAKNFSRCAQIIKTFFFLFLFQNSFDDVKRKFVDPETTKKPLSAGNSDLEHEKSKKSLSEIYEEAFLKQQQSTFAKDKADAASQEAHPAENLPKTETEKIHASIRKQFKELSARLDALTNFRFTPALPEEAEMVVVANVPAMVVEEKVPTAFSDASRLAPEEIYKKKMVQIAGQTELSTAEKKTLRVKSKQAKKAKEKRREKSDIKRLEKSKPGLGNKYSQEKIEEIVKSKVKPTQKHFLFFFF